MTTKHHQYSVDTHDLLNAVTHFLTGPAHAGQGPVLKEREPLLWEVAMALYDNDDMAVRLLGRTLELEALVKHPDVLIATANTLYEQLRKVAPEFPS